MKVTTERTKTACEYFKCVKKGKKRNIESNLTNCFKKGKMEKEIVALEKKNHSDTLLMTSKSERIRTGKS